MLTESDVMPDEYTVKDGSATIRTNIVAVQRTDENDKVRTVYQYDEIKVPLDANAEVTEEYANAVAREEDAGTATLGKGARHIIKHGLKFAPPHVAVSGLPKGSQVFTLGNEGLLFVLPDGAKEGIKISWTAGAYPAGTKRELRKELAAKDERGAIR